MAGTILAFLNEVAGGRGLLGTIRDRVEAGADRVVLVAPENQPTTGQIVAPEEAGEAAWSRVEVTQSVLREFGIDSEATVMDPDSALALDDAIRAFKPSEVLVSCLHETLFGPKRRDLIEWAESRTDVPVTHIPVRIEDDAVRWDVTHTLVVATQTVNSPDLVQRLKDRAAERPHRYTFISPPSGEIARDEVCRRLAATLADLYRSDIDATGQPMSPEPFAAVQNALEHYRIDEVLISTLAGQSSAWLEAGLLDRTKEITDKPVEHFESSGGAAPEREPERVPAGVAASAPGETATENLGEADSEPAMNGGADSEPAAAAEPGDPADPTDVDMETAAEDEEA